MIRSFAAFLIRNNGAQILCLPCRKRSASLHETHFLVSPNFSSTHSECICPLPYANPGVIWPRFASRSFYLVTAMSLISLFAVVLSFARIIVGDFLFIFPTEPGPNADFAADLSFTLGSTQKIEWNTTLESYHIDLYQQIISGDATQQLMTIYST